MRGVSAVISIMLLTAMTTALIGIAFLTFSRTVESAAEKEGEHASQTVSRIGERFVIDGVNRNAVYVRNTGTTPLADLVFYVNDASVEHAGPATVQQQAIGTFYLNDSRLSLLSYPAKLTVASPGFSAEQNAAEFYKNDIASYWRFDENSGTVAYDAANTNDGTITGAEWTAGVYGSALRFDAIDAVDVPDSPSLNRADQITIEAWVRPTGIFAYYHGIVEKGGNPTGKGYALVTYDNTRRVRFEFWGPGGRHRYENTTVELPLNAWSHVTAVFDGSRIRIYINGILDVEKDVADGPFSLAHDKLRIGKRVNDPLGQIAFQGEIDEVRILTVARSMTTR
ncbi:MAG: LamG domain-containing protein [Candidatus Aenigmarchaeota archaeon]|nr:LamG domain-containing protein [Candidatus Aenigmarchaeota archaeon]